MLLPLLLFPVFGDGNRASFPFNLKLSQQVQAKNILYISARLPLIYATT